MRGAHRVGTLPSPACTLEHYAGRLEPARLLRVGCPTALPAGRVVSVWMPSWKASTRVR